MNLSENSYYRAILDAVPIPVFVVDDDVRVRDLNEVATNFCGQELITIHMRRGGEVLHCLHSQDVPQGCGRGPHCQQCVIRTSVNKCLKGQTVSRRRMKMQLLQDAKQKELELLITTSPLSHQGELLALLMVEDISEISALRDIIPICMKCKKIRDDQKYWQDLERFFHENLGVDFSHGVCPGCVDDLYPDFPRKKESSKN